MWRQHPQTQFPDGLSHIWLSWRWENLKRTLKALYHPRNLYAVHLDLEASAEERLEVAKFVKSEPLFKKVGKVRMVTYRVPTMVTNTLHAASILFKEGGDWDWFINLSASDYPFVTQDDLLHTLSAIPRNLIFIEHTSVGGSSLMLSYQRARPVIIDPGLYSLQKSDVFWVSEKRSVPTAYRLFTDENLHISAAILLKFIRFCLDDALSSFHRVLFMGSWGWDNLPRIVLMYYANFLSSPEGYFHTVICNAKGFRNTTVNHDLHFISWDDLPKQHPHFLTANDYQRMFESNAPFARKFGKNEPALGEIDSELLSCNADGFVPGGWFSDEGNSGISLLHHVRTNTTELRPGPGAERLKRLIDGLLSAEDFHAKQCN